MSSARSERRLSVYSRAAAVVLGVALAAVAFSLGGAPVWALWPLVSLCFVALGLALVGSFRQRRSIQLTGLAWVLVAAVVLCALQLIPLPHGLLGLIAPATADLREFVLAPLGISAWGPISLDPPATWRELAKHASYLAAFVAAAQLARSSKGRRLLLVGVAVSGIAVALVSLGHLLANAESLFGIYSFKQAHPPVLSPFGNPNHLSGFLTLGATATLGVALSSSERHHAWFWGLGYVVTGAVVLLSLSRGGIVSFVAAQVLLGLLLLRSRESESESESAENAQQHRRRRLLLAPAFVWVAVAVISVVFVGVYLAAEQLLAELETADSIEKLSSSKIELWPAFFDAVKAYPLAGMGRGAFESAFTRFQVEGSSGIFTHPENVVLQLMAEFGLVPGLLLMLGAGVALFSAMRRVELDTVEASALAGIVGGLLHDVFDFATELPPTALGLVMLLGILGRAHHAGSERRGVSTVGVRVLPTAIGGAVVAALAFVALIPGRYSLAEDEAALAEVIAQGASPQQALAAALPLIERHPADYALPGMLAGVYGASRSVPPDQALALANRTFFLRPLDAEAHRTAARALLRMKRRSQAMLEYRLAWRSGGADYRDEGIARARSLDELQRVTPPEARFALDAAGGLWSSNRQDEALAFITWAREEFAADPDAPKLWAASAGYLHSRKALEQALTAIDRASSAEPSNPDFALSRANILAAMSRGPEALAQLEDALKTNVGHFGLSVALARSLHASGEKRHAREVLQRLGPFVNTPAERASLIAFEASLHRADGRLGKALDGYVSASRILPQNVGYRYEVAGIYEQLNRPAEALREVREGVRIEGRERPEVKAWIDRLLGKERELEEIRKQRRLFGDELAPDALLMGE
ncbi:MAG: O-antigen ligase family protein [Myxococcaceae bacterium]